MEDETVRLTYSELARARGITLAAARRMTLRHKWPKQIGNDGLSHVLVPASALARFEGDAPGDGTGNAPNDMRHAGTADGTGALTGNGKDDTLGAGTDDATGITAAVQSLSEAVASLGAQLIRERERADRAEDRVRDVEGYLRDAEDRARAAEGRVRELQDQLTEEMIEHRQMVALLLKRRSWWPWRRRS